MLFKKSVAPPSTRKHTAIPGFGITMTFTLVYILLIVLIPLSGLFIETFSLSFQEFWQAITATRVLNAYRVSLVTSLIAASINMVFGLIVAWVIVRYRFPGRKVLNAIVDLPFALPTAVAGIALTVIYAQDGLIGKLFKPFGIKIVYTPLGIIIALVLVGLPFVVRTVQPVLEDMGTDQEESAAILGASRFKTFFRIIIPTIMPALLAGFAMAFARAIGEYGSVIFIAGNIPNVSEIVPLLIVIKLEQYDYAGACAIATVMLLISFVILFIINLLQKWSGSRKPI